MSVSDDLRGIDTVGQLLERIDVSWHRLQATIRGIGEDVLTERRDAAGWSAKDHLAHIAWWERSLTALLAGESRCGVLGLPPGTPIGPAVEEVNARVQAAGRDRSLADVLAELCDVHAATRAAIAALSDERLRAPIGAFVGPGQGDDVDRPVLELLADDTFRHFDEHLTWMAPLLTR